MFWIPLIGPIIQGIVSMFTSFQNTTLGKYKVDGSVDIETIKASSAIIESTKDDIGIRILRDMLLLPPIVHAGIVGWDTIIVWEYPQWFYKLPPYPPSLSYLPLACFTFLLGNMAINVWRRK